MSAPSVSVYVHFPYCIRKCDYCAFFSLACAGGGIPDLTGAYMRELDCYHGILSGRKITSIYFGGGTPSLADPRMFERIIERLGGAPETTIEVNPATADEQKLRDFAAAGINRASIGMQSLDDGELAFLGRPHSALEAAECLDAARRAFDNVSADFIYALPGQSIEKWGEALNKIKSLGLSHYSLYQLSIEPKTRLFSRKIKSPDDKIAAGMLSLSRREMKDAAPQYEVSNYARPGFESRHNANYWTGGDYIGIGPAAAGRIRLDDKFYETQNPRSVEKWAASKPAFKPLPRKCRAREMAMTGLRMNRGISLDEFCANCGLELWDVADRNRFLEYGIAGAKRARLRTKNLAFLDYILGRVL
ncbi:MAG: radical SAM family heme chaperone HemW [Rickettsiales bacterium]|jgi:oxygen-independent coproporphyrinogen-3 oxidase|nr:radical SAM family heme chaperone HemW [Rickettsiales bacterium]